MTDEELQNSPVWSKEMVDKVMGAKHDTGKPRWSLLPCGTITAVIGVLEFGAARYGVDNWMHVEEAGRRYYDATMRHIEAWLLGEKNDPESGLPHLAHAVCCLLFLIWFDERKQVATVTPCVTMADAWIARFREGVFDAPDADEVRFPDGSRVVWDGRMWWPKND